MRYITTLAKQLENQNGASDDEFTRLRGALREQACASRDIKLVMEHVISPKVIGFIAEGERPDDMNRIGKIDLC